MRRFRTDRYLITPIWRSMALLADFVFPIVILIILEMIHALGPMVFLILIDPLSSIRVGVKPNDFSILATSPSTGIGIRMPISEKRVDPHATNSFIAALCRT